MNSTLTNYYVDCPCANCAAKTIDHSCKYTCDGYINYLESVLQRNRVEQLEKQVQQIKNSKYDEYHKYYNIDKVAQRNESMQSRKLNWKE